MEEPMDSKGRITSSDILSEWSRINDVPGSHVQGRLSFVRKCPFDPKMLVKAKHSRLVIAGLAGIILGITGIHFFILRHYKKGTIRLLILVLLIFLYVFGISLVVNNEENLGIVLVALASIVALGLFLFGFEEGSFLICLGFYRRTQSFRESFRRLLQIRIGRVSLETIIKCVLVVLFIGSMGYAYWVSMVRH